MIKDLKDRLKSHRPYIPPLEGVAFEYGFNSKQMNSWIKYWAEEYPFAEREQVFNKYPQFKTNIQGLDIHFIRVKPEVYIVLFLQSWKENDTFFVDLLIRTSPGTARGAKSFRPS